MSSGSCEDLLGGSRSTTLYFVTLDTFLTNLRHKFLIYAMDIIIPDFQIFESINVFKVHSIVLGI